MKRTPSCFRVSWKTSVSGLIFAAGCFVMLLLALVFFAAHCGYTGHFRWANPRAIYGLASLACLLMGCGGIGIGLFARDHDKSSEDAEIKNERTPQ